MLIHVCPGDVTDEDMSQLTSFELAEPLIPTPLPPYRAYRVTLWNPLRPSLFLRVCLKTISPSTSFPNLQAQAHESKLHMLLIPECFYVNVQGSIRTSRYRGCGDRSGALEYIELDCWGRLWSPRDGC